MMTWNSGPCEPGETTARDRAIEMDVDEALELAERVSAPGSAGQSLAAEVRRLRALAGAPTADVATPSKFREMAKVIEDALSDYHRYDGLGDHEEWLAETARQLRALAGAPTADVASEPVASNVRGAADWLLYFYADPSHQGEDDQTAAAYWALGDDLAGKLIDAFRELARLRAAAPEGVDAAADRSALAERIAEVLEHEREDDIPECPDADSTLGCRHDHQPEPGCATCGTWGWPCGLALAVADAVLQPAAPEGVDAADERAAVSRLWAQDWDSPEDAVYDALDGMDLEAQGEMADELTAAQAAIQRVRDVCVDWECYGADRLIQDIRRALDGADVADELTRVHAELTEYGNKYAQAARELAAAQAEMDRLRAVLTEQAQQWENDSQELHRDEIDDSDDVKADALSEAYAEAAVFLRRALDGDTTEEA